MPTTVRLAFPLVALALMAGACSEPEDRPLPSPSSAFPSQTRPVFTGPSPTGMTGATGASGMPAPGAGELTRGRITMQISGEVEAEATLDQVISAVYSPPPGALAIVWASGTDANVVGLGVGSFTCAGLTSSAGRVADASASFEAAR